MFTFILNVLLLIMVFVTESILSKVKGENTKQTSGQDHFTFAVKTANISTPCMFAAITHI